MRERKGHNAIFGATTIKPQKNVSFRAVYFSFRGCLALFDGCIFLLHEFLLLWCIFLFQCRGVYFSMVQTVRLFLRKKYSNQGFVCKNVNGLPAPNQNCAEKVWCNYFCKDKGNLQDYPKKKIFLESN